VDSSVAAALLQRGGYDVIGVTMRIGLKGFGPSETATVAVEAANRAASTLGIPLRVVDCGEAFQQVVDRFMDEYSRGRTPNPCVHCNRCMKFALLLDLARAEDAAFIATGHYARVERAASGRFVLKKALHVAKDQSYALARLTQEQLSRVRFPVGEMSKDEARRIAGELGMIIDRKEESQDICFIPDGDYPAFIERLRPGTFKEGDIVTLDGEVVGRHRGFQAYTIGQRRGLRVAFGRPMYVVRTEPESNRVVVGTKDDLERNELTAREVNWIVDPHQRPLRATVKIRYSHPGAAATVEPLGGERVHVCFDTPQSAVTPGQAAVFHDGDIVLGGGWIE